MSSEVVPLHAPRVIATGRGITGLTAWPDTPFLRQRIVSRQVRGPANFTNRYHPWRGGMPSLTTN